MNDYADSGELLESFLTDAETLYEEALEALNLLKTGSVAEGLQHLARPLHTLKGTAGFISGLEPIGSYAHQLEDHLLEIRAQPIAWNQSVQAWVASSVEQIFAVIEQIKSGDEVEVPPLSPWPQTSPAPSLQEQMAQQTAAAAHQPQTAPIQSNDFHLEQREGWLILHPLVKRIHKGQQYLYLKQLEGEIQEGSKLALDLSPVMSMGSEGWGALSQLAKRCSLAVFGMAEGNACERTFRAFGFSRLIQVYKNEQELFQEAK